MESLKTYEETKIARGRSSAKCIPEVWGWKANLGDGREYRAVLCGKEIAPGIIGDVEKIQPVFVIEVRGDDDVLGQPSWRRINDQSGFAMAINLIWSQRSGMAPTPHAPIEGLDY